MVEHHGVVGETPNVAARIEKLAPPDTVLISGATYDLVAFHFRCIRLELQRIEGISRAVDIYRVDEAMGRLIGLEGQVGDSIPLVDRRSSLACCETAGPAPSGAMAGCSSCRVNPGSARAG